MTSTTNEQSSSTAMRHLQARVHPGIFRQVQALAVERQTTVSAATRELLAMALQASKAA